jgi:hypothetical protein
MFMSLQIINSEKLYVNRNTVTEIRKIFCDAIYVNGNIANKNEGNNFLINISILRQWVAPTEFRKIQEYLKAAPIQLINL